MTWRSCVATLVLLVGIVLSPLRSAGAAIPVLIAYSTAAAPSATTVLGPYDAVRSEAERPSINAYDPCRVSYESASNPRVAAGVEEIGAYDEDLELADQREVNGQGAIYDAASPPTAAEGVEGIALREGESAASGMQAHHIFPQQMAEQFEAGGVNIEEFRVQLSEGTHLGQLHSSGGIPGVGPGGLWNETWRQYLAGEAAAGRALTPQGLMGQAAQMLGDFNVPYYSPLPGP